MEKIMKKPNNLTRYRLTISYFTGQDVKNKFYNQSLGYGSLRVDYIPDELKDKKWVPDDDKRYECHWYYTNPADPADPGEDILIYIEEIEEDVAKKMEIEYISKINHIVSKLSLEQLKNLSNYLERRYRL